MAQAFNNCTLNLYVTPMWNYFYVPICSLKSLLNLSVAKFSFRIFPHSFTYKSTVGISRHLPLEHEFQSLTPAISLWNSISFYSVDTTLGFDVEMSLILLQVGQSWEFLIPLGGVFCCNTCWIERNSYFMSFDEIQWAINIYPNSLMCFWNS